jgi:hypothetical protein
MTFRKRSWTISNKRPTVQVQLVKILVGLGRFVQVSSRLWTAIGRYFWTPRIEAINGVENDQNFSSGISLLYPFEGGGEAGGVKRLPA